MRKTIAILFSTLILAVSVGDLAIYISFKLNQTFIAANWCVQKDIVSNKCQGKCFLKKQLQEANDTEQSTFPFLELKKLKPQYFFASKTSTSISPEFNISTINFYFLEKKSQTHFFDIFHPPKRLTA